MKEEWIWGRGEKDEELRREKRRVRNLEEWREGNYDWDV